MKRPSVSPFLFLFNIPILAVQMTDKTYQMTGESLTIDSAVVPLYPVVSHPMPSFLPSPQGSLISLSSKMTFFPSSQYPVMKYIIFTWLDTASIFVPNSLALSYSSASRKTHIYFNSDLFYWPLIYSLSLSEFKLTQ